MVALLELFDQPIPDIAGVPSSFLEILRLGMANDPLARPTATRLRDLLAELPLDRGPAPAVRGTASVPSPRTAPHGVSGTTQRPDPLGRRRAQSRARRARRSGSG